MMIEFALRNLRLDHGSAQTLLFLLEVFEHLAGEEFAVGAQRQLTGTEFPVQFVLIDPVGEFGLVGLRGRAHNNARDQSLALRAEESDFITERGFLAFPGCAATVPGDPIGIRVALRSRQLFVFGRGLVAGRLLGRGLFALHSELRLIAFVENPRPRFGRRQSERHFSDFGRTRVGRGLAETAPAEVESVSGFEVAADNQRCCACANATVLARNACHCS